MSRRYIGLLSAVVVAVSMSLWGPAYAAPEGAARSGSACTGRVHGTVRDHAAGRSARGRRRHPGLLDRLRGRPVLRQRLAHHRRDGRRLDAAAQARRRRVVRARRPVGRPGDEVLQRLGLHPLRPARRRPGWRSQRTDFVPDGRRGALFGLTITNPGAARTAKLTVDAHSELMGQYPWGFTGVTPNASDNLPDKGTLRRPRPRVHRRRRAARRAGAPLRGARRHRADAGLGHDRRPVLGTAARPPLHRHRAGRAGRPQAVAVRRRPVRQGHRRRADLHAVAAGRRLADRLAGRRRLRPRPRTARGRSWPRALRNPARQLAAKIALAGSAGAHDPAVAAR